MKRSQFQATLNAKLRKSIIHFGYSNKFHHNFIFDLTDGLYSLQWMSKVTSRIKKIMSKPTLNNNKNQNGKKKKDEDKKSTEFH